jgi:hypothetical protein
LITAQSNGTALKVSKIGIFAALYAATSLIPISVFIGASGFLGLNLIITPVMAILLMPDEAFFAGLFGGIAAFYVAPMQAMFGPYTILLPVAGATIGSLAYHKGKVGAAIAALFLGGLIFAYLLPNYLFPYFVIPHMIAFGIALVSSFKRMTPLKIKVPMYAFVATLTEQGVMMFFSVYLLKLPWQVFPAILPLMIYERALATVGSSLVILALLKVLPQQFSKIKGKI